MDPAMKLEMAGQRRQETPPQYLGDLICALVILMIPSY